MKGYFNAFFQKTSLQSEHTTLVVKIVSLRVVNRKCTNLPTKLWPNVTFLVYLVDVEWAVPFLQQVFGSFQGNQFQRLHKRFFRQTSSFASCITIACLFRLYHLVFVAFAKIFSLRILDKIVDVVCDIRPEWPKCNLCRLRIFSSKPSGFVVIKN